MIGCLYEHNCMRKSVAMYLNRLLILDDEPLTGQTIQSIAEFAGMEVRYTSDPDDFFTLVSDWEPGFIALDLIMPQMDGVQVLGELANRNCTANIIVTSGVGTRVLEAAARSAAEHGLRIAGVLSKPFSPPRLRELLKPGIHGPDGPPVQHNGSMDEQQTPFTKADLAAALDQKLIEVVYQPKVHCRTGMLSGFEALARWQHPPLGPVYTEEFIVKAEQWGLIDRLTEQVLEKSLDWLKSLPETISVQSGDTYLPSRMESVTLALNISATSLGNLKFFERLEKICRGHGIEPSRIILELTETSAMEDPVASLDILTRLRMKGFQLSIDDFGTGYSSMLQLARLPFSEIKVDKSFVTTAQQSAESRTVIKSIVDLGHGLGLQATAEGIEDEETLQYLRDIGCDMAQGYHIARPMPADQVVTWLLNRPRDTEETRLEILHAIGLLDTPEEERFDRITRLCSKLFDMPISLVTLVDADRQWFKSAEGLEKRETPRDVSFCSHAIAGHDEVMVVHDTHRDERFARNPLVTGEPYIRFYAGCTIRANGSKLGTLCLLDNRSRDESEFTDSHRQLLLTLAAMAETELAADPKAVTSPLTGLWNRRGFEQRAKELLELAQREKIPTHLLFFDLDDFGAYNKAYGVQAGDTCLYDFAILLRHCMPFADLVCHFGNDEFAVLSLFDSSNEIQRQLDYLRSRFHRSLQADGRLLDFTVGQARLCPDDRGDLQRLLVRADQDMPSHH